MISRITHVIALMTGGACITFLIEGIFPLGDWRWLLFAVLFFIIAWLSRPDEATRGHNNKKPGPIVRALAESITKDDDTLAILVVLFGGGALLVFFILMYNFQKIIEAFIRVLTILRSA